MVTEQFPAIVDTHTHICDAAFDEDRSQVLHRAKTAGVGAVIAVSENLADARKNLELAKQFPMIRPAAALFPAVLDLQQAEEMKQFIVANRQELVAIGEVGLDHWMVKEESGQELQREIFLGFIELANELDLPLNVHSRSAGRRAIQLLIEAGAKRVQLHAFDGKASSALPAVEAGFFFSVPPSVVRSEQKQKLIKRLPLSCLLVETDSPVLGPDPDQRNEPANAVIAVRAIAELKGIRPEEVIVAAKENTQRLYGFALGMREAV
jgi:TatD DNase family protein